MLRFSFMSAFADFIRLPASAVDHLRSDYDETLEQGEVAADYFSSGYVLSTLLPYLDEHGITFDQTPHDALASELCQQEGMLLFMLLTPAHRDAHLDQLSAERFSIVELQAYYNEFTASKEGPEIGEATLDGIACFRESLASLADGSVVVFTIR